MAARTTARRVATRASRASFGFLSRQIVALDLFCLCYCSRALQFSEESLEVAFFSPEEIQQLPMHESIRYGSSIDEYEVKEDVLFIWG